MNCSICLGEATEPVVTRCGHLFCWRCLMQWRKHHHQDQRQDVAMSSGDPCMVIPCPVCKGAVDMSNSRDVIRIYDSSTNSRTSTGAADVNKSEDDHGPGLSTNSPTPPPPRPDRAAEPPRPRRGIFDGNPGGGVHFQFGGFPLPFIFFIGGGIMDISFLLLLYLGYCLWTRRHHIQGMLFHGQNTQNSNQHHQPRGNNPGFLGRMADVLSVPDDLRRPLLQIGLVLLLLIILSVAGDLVSANESASNNVRDTNDWTQSFYRILQQQEDSKQRHQEQQRPRSRTNRR